VKYGNNCVIIELHGNLKQSTFGCFKVYEKLREDIIQEEILNSGQGKYLEYKKMYLRTLSLCPEEHCTNLYVIYMSYIYVLGAH
jgi:hypothetical protein